MAKKTNYKMPERNLDLPADMAFVNNLLKDLGLEADSSSRGVILDLAYSELKFGERLKGKEFVSDLF